MDIVLRASQGVMGYRGSKTLEPDTWMIIPGYDRTEEQDSQGIIPKGLQGRFRGLGLLMLGWTSFGIDSNIG